MSVCDAGNRTVANQIVQRCAREKRGGPRLRCSGPWGDPEFKGSVEEGLPALRSKWIRGRGDVENTPAAK